MKAWSDRKTLLASTVNTMPMVFGIAAGVEVGATHWSLFWIFTCLAVVFEWVASVLWMLAYKGMAQDSLTSPATPGGTQ
jgi:hypothetical protein